MPHGSRLLRPISIDLNAVAMRWGVAQQLNKPHAIAHAGIERREAFRENETILQPVGLG